MFIFLMLGLVNCWSFSVSETVGFVTSDSTSANTSLNAIDLYGLSNGGTTIFVETTAGLQQLYHALNGTFENLIQPETIIALNAAQNLTFIQLLNGSFYLTTATLKIPLPVDSIQQGVLVVTSTAYYTLGQNNSNFCLLKIFPNATVNLYPLPASILAVYTAVDDVVFLKWTGVGFLLVYGNGSVLSTLQQANALVVVGNFLEDQTTVETDSNILLPEDTILSNSSWLLLRLLSPVPQSSVDSSVISMSSLSTAPSFPLSNRGTYASTLVTPLYITSTYQLISGTVYSGPVIIGTTSTVSVLWNPDFTPIQFSQLNITGGTLIVNLNNVKYADGSTIELFNYAAGEGQFSQILVVGAATSSCVQTKAIPEYQNNKVYLHLEIATSCLTAVAGLLHTLPLLFI